MRLLLFLSIISSSGFCDEKQWTITRPSDPHPKAMEVKPEEKKPKASKKKKKAEPAAKPPLTE